MNFEIITRLLSETPKFWRKVQKFCLAGLAVVAALRLQPDLIPDEVLPYIKYAFVVLTTVLITAQTTCNDGGTDQRNS
ncbi:hypothetical protein GCM10011383_37390 [Hymenobacter cavernae]|uniref:Holin n=1 Tax=Hymenobacter cavernae TaxID=2044852 RepID=A0ABQ1UM01_9BACT|nr:hypothetical protein GCM10011383_37390 [Hymenobacter cavernae]